MKIIDAHMHYSNVQAFFGAADDSKVDYSYEGLKKEQEENNIIGSVCMGLNESVPWSFPDKNAQSPMNADLGENLSTMKVCLGINPYTIDEQRLREAIKHKNIAGFKIYAGYYHFYVHDPVYTPVYKIAAEHGLVIAIHTGDTYSEEGLLEYSHPLAADRIAIAFRDVNFMLCHMGEPWCMDACEVAYKNRNIYLDISGLQAGDVAHLEEVEKRQLVMNHYMTGLQFLNNYKKILFGTDWPLVPLGKYVDFCKKLLPESSYDEVFYKNAVELFSF